MITIQDIIDYRIYSTIPNDSKTNKIEVLTLEHTPSIPQLQADYEECLKWCHGLSNFYLVNYLPNNGGESKRIMITLDFDYGVFTHGLSSGWLRIYVDEKDNLEEEIKERILRKLKIEGNCVVGTLTIDNKSNIRRLYGRERWQEDGQVRCITCKTFCRQEPKAVFNFLTSGLKAMLSEQ